jgi:hypothetical protein
MMPGMDERKRRLVERAVTAAVRARPVLDKRAAALAELVPLTDGAIAAARTWLASGDPQPSLDACAAVAPAIERAWRRWDDHASLTRDLIALKRAVHAAEAAALAARAAAWSPFDHAIRDDAAAEDRAADGPVREVFEAERCAALALGLM